MEFSELFKEFCLKNVSVAGMYGWVEGEWKLSQFGLPDDFLEDPEMLAKFGHLKGQVKVFDGWEEGKDHVVWHSN